MRKQGNEDVACGRGLAPHIDVIRASQPPLGLFPDDACAWALLKHILMQKWSSHSSMFSRSRDLTNSFDVASLKLIDVATSDLQRT